MRSARQHIVNELITTERIYVQHLELLQVLKKLSESSGAIDADSSRQIFHNLDPLLDLQRRFLRQVEQVNAQPKDEQNWGQVFITFNELFVIYEQYIANQKLCEGTVVRKFDKLKEAASPLELPHLVESPVTLCASLMRPCGRLAKYPLLLEQLHSKGDYDEERKEDLLKGKECVINVLARISIVVENQDKLEAFEELKSRMDDWKGHKVDGFGQLLLFGTYMVIKNDHSPNEEKKRKRNYHLYLFESILLCCKDINPNKPENNTSSKSLVDEKGNPKMKLKGRIWMKDITDISKTSRAGVHACQIFWTYDQSIKDFTVEFASGVTMGKWYRKLVEQKNL